MKKLLWCAAAAASVLSTAALAQDYNPATPDPTYTPAPGEPYSDPVVPPPDYSATPATDADDTMSNKTARWTRKVGLQVDVGGGVSQFLDKTANNLTDMGGGWQARLVVGTRSHIAGELAYVGTAQAVDAVGLASNATLMSNGGQGLFRVNVLTGAWQPYAAAGYTFRRYQITNSDVSTADIVDGANSNEIPVAMGLAYRFKPLVADARLTLNNAFGTPLIRDSNLSTVAADLKIGFEF